MYDSLNSSRNTATMTFRRQVALVSFQRECISEELTWEIFVIVAFVEFFDEIMAGHPQIYNAVVHDALKPLSWLIGRWKTDQGKGYYPTIEPFSYCEEVEFTSIGQPILNYHSYSWHPEKKNPMHLEAGFLRIKPGTNELAFMVAHNFGLSVIEEGTVDGSTVVLETKEIGRMSFAKGSAVVKTLRSLTLEGDKLRQVISMATDTQPMTEHLTALYERVGILISSSGNCEQPDGKNPHRCSGWPEETSQAIDSFSLFRPGRFIEKHTFSNFSKINHLKASGSV